MPIFLDRFLNHVAREFMLLGQLSNAWRIAYKMSFLISLVISFRLTDRWFWVPYFRCCNILHETGDDRFQNNYSQVRHISQDFSREQIILNMDFDGSMNLTFNSSN
jgi:hypothetical protein